MKNSENRWTAARAIRMEGFLTDESREWLMSRPKPERLCGALVPDTLNGLTYGELNDLQEARDQIEFVCQISRIILGLDAKQVLNAPASDVYGFVLWVGREIERINALFASIKDAPSSDEIKAGAGQLSFGVFGVCDWYARRMGMVDQDDVLKVKWVRIYRCMEMDAKTAAFEKRLRKIISNKK